METQPELFGNTDELETRPRTHGLVIGKSRKVPLSKSQEAFNRLASRIEELRGKIQGATQRWDGWLAFYGTELNPLERRVNEARKLVVRSLLPFLTGRLAGGMKSWKALRKVISGHLHEILMADGELKDQDLLAAFERVEGVSMEQAQSDSFDALRADLESYLETRGVQIDLSDLRPDMSPTEIAARMAELEEGFRQQHHQQRARPSRPRPKSKRQLAKEARECEIEALRAKDVGGLYRQLAKLLHPDLEQDPVRRLEKETAMKELTVAYGKNDLHAMLKLEIEWIHREQAEGSRLTDEKLAVFNRVLKEQVEELEVALAEVGMHPRFAPLREYLGRFAGHESFDGTAECSRLRGILDELERSAAALGSPTAKQEVKAILNSFGKMDRSDPFG